MLRVYILIISESRSPIRLRSLSLQPEFVCFFHVVGQRACLKLFEFLDPESENKYFYEDRAGIDKHKGLHVIVVQI